MDLFSKKKRLLLILPILMTLFSLVFCLSACDMLEELTSGPNEESQGQEQQLPEEETSEETGQDQETQQEETAEEGPPTEEVEEPPQEEQQQSQEESEQGEDSDSEFGELTVNVYYADSQGQYLVPEKRVISKENKLMDALYELLKLPTDNELVRVIPETTRILGITVENGIADVNFSKEFVEDRFISDTVDILLVYSVVNTLTEFNEIDAVNFYIEGDKLDILGELDIKNPIYRRSDLIAQ